MPYLGNFIYTISLLLLSSIGIVIALINEFTTHKGISILLVWIVGLSEHIFHHHCSFFLSPSLNSDLCNIGVHVIYTSCALFGFFFFFIFLFLKDYGTTSFSSLASAYIGTYEGKYTIKCVHTGRMLIHIRHFNLLGSLVMFQPFWALHYTPFLCSPSTLNLSFINTLSLVLYCLMV